jgi:uncharacterized protein YndB with AHSA1/START domain
MNARTQDKRPVTLVEPGTVRLERLLPGPVERVWAYITESDKRAKWLAAGEFELRVGGKAVLKWDNAKLPNAGPVPPEYKNRGIGEMVGVITRLEPHRVLAHTWPKNGADMEVTYELSPRGKDVLLTIVHRRLGKDLTSAVMGGWDVHTGILEDILKGLEPRPFWRTHERLEREYGAGL